LCGVHSLSFAVGAYLPLSTTSPIFVGSLMRVLVNKMSQEKEESELSAGMLYSTGLVAGGSLTGIAIALLGGIVLTSMVDGQAVEMPILQRVLDFVGVHGWESLGAGADLIGIAMFGVLCVLLVNAARKKLEI